MARAVDRRVLSSLDQLPEECQDDVVWALARLNERSRTQTDILFELNDRLAVKGQGPISRSAFSRRNVRLKRRRDRLEERNAMYAGIAPTITTEKITEQDVVLGEILKAIIDERADEASSAKDIMDLTAAFRNVVTAQHTSLKRQQQAVAAAGRKLEKAVAAAVGEATKVVDAAQVLAMIRKAYGVDA